MDYDDDFFKKLRPQTQDQQHFIYWILMTHTNGADARYGNIPKAGINPIFDVFYSSLATAYRAFKVAEMHETMDEATRKRLEELSLLAGKVGDDAASIGSALLTLEQRLVESNEPRLHMQIERTSRGHWTVNQMAHGDTLKDAIVNYCTKRIEKIKPRKKEG